VSSATRTSTEIKASPTRPEARSSRRARLKLKCTFTSTRWLWIDGALYGSSRDQGGRAKTRRTAEGRVDRARPLMSSAQSQGREGRRNEERQRGRSKGGRPSTPRLVGWGSRRGARTPRSPGGRAGGGGRGGGMAGCVRPENTALPKLLGGPATSRAGFKLSRW